MIDNNSFEYINFSDETISEHYQRVILGLISGITRKHIWRDRTIGVDKGLFKTYRKRKMEEIGVKRLHIVIPQLFGELQALRYLGEIETVVRKLLLYREVGERKKGDRNHD